MERGQTMLNELLNGAILVAFDRYYKLQDNQLFYSDCLCCWKASKMTVNEFLQVPFEIYKRGAAK